MLNEVFYEGKGYYLSYLDKGKFGKEQNIPLFGDETAVCVEEPWECLVLNGDHREQMKPIASDLDALREYYTSH